MQPSKELGKKKDKSKTTKGKYKRQRNRDKKLKQKAEDRKWSNKNRRQDSTRTGVIQGLRGPRLQGGPME